MSAVVPYAERNRDTHEFAFAVMTVMATGAGGVAAVAIDADCDTLAASLA